MSYKNYKISILITVPEFTVHIPGNEMHTVVDRFYIPIKIAILTVSVVGPTTAEDCAVGMPQRVHNDMKAHQLIHIKPVSQHRIEICGAGLCNRICKRYKAAYIACFFIGFQSIFQGLLRHYCIVALNRPNRFINIAGGVELSAHFLENMNLVVTITIAINADMVGTIWMKNLLCRNMV